MDETDSVKVPKKLRKILREISDDNCVLVKFTNKDVDEYAVGFACWLKNSNSDDFDINYLIENKDESIIYWPKYLAIKPANMLGKLLTDAEFTAESVTLMSHGDWVDMRKQLKSLESTGTLNVTKTSRKRLMQKASTSQTKPKVANKGVLKAAQKNATKQQNADILTQTKKVPQSPYINWNEIEEVNENSGGHNPESSISHTFDSGFDDACTSPSIKKKMKKKDCAPVKKSDKQGNENYDQSTSPKTNSKVKTKLPSRTVTTSTLLDLDDSEPEFDDENYGKSGNQSKTSSSVKPSKKGDAKIKPPRLPRFPLTRPPQDEEESEEDGELPDKNQVDDTVKYQAFKKGLRNEKSPEGFTEEDKVKYDPELPVGVKRAPPLPDAIIKACLSQRKIQSFVSGLADNFFEKTYLAEHSPTGKTPNMLRQMNIQPKPALHPPIVAYIRDLATKYFGCQVGIQGKVTKALSDKISGVRPKGNDKNKTSATGN